MTNFWMDMAKLWAFGISGVALMFVGYWIFDRLTPKIDFAKELVENKNVAVAIMVAAIIFGVAVIVAATIFFPIAAPPAVAMNKTTNSITLVLISSACVFCGWGCPLGHEADHPPAGQGNRSSSSGYYHHYGYYGGGFRPGYYSGGSSTPVGGRSGSSGAVSSRGGFGSSGHSVGT